MLILQTGVLELLFGTHVLERVLHMGATFR